MSQNLTENFISIQAQTLMLLPVFWIAMMPT